MELAIDIYKATLEKDGKASIMAVAKEYGIARESLRDRVNGGAQSREGYAHARQRLVPAEEKVLEEYCLKLEEWGCPARISQLRVMAEGLLKAKGDTAPLGKNWPSTFLDRHPNLKSVLRLHKIQIASFPKTGILYPTGFSSTKIQSTSSRSTLQTHIIWMRRELLLV